MSRADGKQFDANVSGNIGNYIDVGAKAKVDSQQNSVVSFSSANNQSAAFAYKAGQLRKVDPKRWTFAPELVKRLAENKAPAESDDFWTYVPKLGVVLEVANK
jgi:hypothetical protein